MKMTGEIVGMGCLKEDKILALYVVQVVESDQAIQVVAPKGMFALDDSVTITVEKTTASPGPKK